MRDTKSILLVLLSACLACTWVYHFYDKSVYSSRMRTVTDKRPVDPMGAPDTNNLVTRLADEDSPLVKTGTREDILSQRMSEIIRLRNEIAVILQKQNLTAEDLQLARHKTDVLEKKVRELELRNTTIAEEKADIGRAFLSVNARVSELETHVRELTSENSILRGKLEQSGTFTASDLKLVPLTASEGNEQETSLARQASRLMVSFTVQNSQANGSDGEIYVIITQPDGKVLKSDVWESFSVETRREGRRSYTRKIQFDYVRGQRRHLSFSLPADDFSPGLYQLELYNNGYRIGNASRMLN